MLVPAIKILLRNNHQVCSIYSQSIQSKGLLYSLLSKSFSTLQLQLTVAVITLRFVPIPK